LKPHLLSRKFKLELISTTVFAPQALLTYLAKSNQVNECLRQVTLAHLRFGYVIRLHTTLLAQQFQSMVVGLRSKAK
jgi:hypothetical protein